MRPPRCGVTTPAAPAARFLPGPLPMHQHTPAPLQRQALRRCFARVTARTSLGQAAPQRSDSTNLPGAMLDGAEHCQQHRRQKAEGRTSGEEPDPPQPRLCIGGVARRIEPLLQGWSRIRVICRMLQGMLRQSTERPEGQRHRQHDEHSEHERQAGWQYEKQRQRERAQSGNVGEADLSSMHRARCQPRASKPEAAA